MQDQVRVCEHLEGGLQTLTAVHPQDSTAASGTGALMNQSAIICEGGVHHGIN